MRMVNSNNQSRSSNQQVPRGGSISGREKNKKKKNCQVCFGDKKNGQVCFMENFLDDLFGLKFQTIILWKNPYGYDLEKKRLI